MKFATDEGEGHACRPISLFLQALALAYAQQLYALQFLRLRGNNG